MMFAVVYVRFGKEEGEVFSCGADWLEREWGSLDAEVFRGGVGMPMVRGWVLATMVFAWWV